MCQPVGHSLGGNFMPGVVVLNILHGIGWRLSPARVLWKKLEPTWVYGSMILTFLRCEHADASVFPSITCMAVDCFTA